MLLQGMFLSWPSIDGSLSVPSSFIPRGRHVHFAWSDILHLHPILRGSYLSFRNLDELDCFLTSLFLCWLWRQLEWPLDDYQLPNSSLPLPEYLDGDLVTSLYVSSISIRPFHVITVSYSFCPMEVSDFCLTNVALCGMNEFELNTQFGSLLAAGKMSTYFAVWAFNVSPIKDLRSRSSTNSSTMSYMTDGMTIWAWWNTVRNMFSSDF